MLVTRVRRNSTAQGVARRECPFDSALEHLDAGVLLLDDAGRIKYTNARARSFYGVSDAPRGAEEALGSELSAALGAAREYLQEVHEHAVELALPNQARVKLFAARCESGDVLVTLREAHPAMEASAVEAAYRRVLERHGFGLWSYDAVTQDLWWSPQSYELLGTTPGTVSLNWAQEHVHPDDRQAFAEAFSRVYERGEYAVRFRVPQEGGGTKYLQDRGEVVARTLDGRPALIVGVTVDRTRVAELEHEVRGLREQLDRVSQLGAAGQLAAAVAHDLNNALTVITCNASLMLDQPTSDVTRKTCTAMLQAAEYASDIAYRLLDFVRASPLSLERTELGAFFRDAKPLLRSIVPESIDCVFDLGSQALWADIDRRRLQQVLCNLLMNATHAVQPNGRIDIVVSRDGECVRIHIKDDGVGIAPELRARIFEPLFTTREAGAGLGLASVRTVMEQHGGEVTVQSQLGAGATFILSLPATVPGESEAIQPSCPQVPLLTYVWVVEDRPMLRQLVEGILRAHGHTVESFGDPRAVLRRLDSGATPPTVLLSDVVMPIMSGVELIEEVRRRQPDIRAIFMSGYAAPLLDERSRIPAGEMSIPKPFSRQQLLESIDVALASRVP